MIHECNLHAEFSLELVSRVVFYDAEQCEDDG